jgi:RNA polymerase sigma factor (sigma-70 family)
VALEDDFNALWEAHHRQVLAYALRRTDAASAQDVAAETFTVAWRRAGEIPRDALPWLLGVARKVLANQSRSHRRQAALANELADAARDFRPSGDTDHELFAALAALTETDREALILSGWDGLSAAQAGRVLGCSAAAFRVRLLRARRRLAIQLQRDHADAGQPVEEGAL